MREKESCQTTPESQPRSSHNSLTNSAVTKMILESKELQPKLPLPKRGREGVTNFKPNHAFFFTIKIDQTIFFYMWCGNKQFFSNNCSVNNKICKNMFFFIHNMQNGETNYFFPFGLINNNFFFSCQLKKKHFFHGCLRNKQFFPKFCDTPIPPYFVNGSPLIGDKCLLESTTYEVLSIIRTLNMLPSRHQTQSVGSVCLSNIPPQCDATCSF